MNAQPQISIRYCTQCNWLLRSAWMAQELLSTLGQDLSAVTLIPDTGGVFRIEADGDLIWDRKTDGGFPDISLLKRKIRDHYFPERPLGHTDQKA